MKILIVNGPNLNLIKSRKKDHYGSSSLQDILYEIEKNFPSIEFTMVQTNSEADIINYIQDAEHGNFAGIILNPGGYSHTSIPIRDALEICKLPKVEVHLSNIQSRENYRKISLTGSVCDGYISGFKNISYLTGVYTLLKLIETKST